MKQYCRYCVHLYVNNFPYCEIKKKEVRYSMCIRPNHCKDFEFADCDAEYQDAFGITNGYHPRSERKKKINVDNVNLFEVAE